MVHDRLIVAATSNSRELGKKVCKALDTKIKREFEKLGVTERWQIPPWDVLKEKRYDRLVMLKADNRASFGSEEFRLWPVKRVDFNSTEFKIEIDKSVRGANVFLIHQSFRPVTPPEKILFNIMNIVSTGVNERAYQEIYDLLNRWHNERTVSENDMELFYTVSTLKRDAGARKVIVFNPLLSNERQDHRRKREGITARDFLHLLNESGCDELFVFDIHSIGTLAASVDMKIDNLYPTGDLVSEFKKRFPNYRERFVIIAPDAGAAKKCEHFAKQLDLPVYIASKVRDYDSVGVVDRVILPYPDHLLKDKHALIIDDMVDTGGTLFKVMDACKDKGIGKFVVMVTHFLGNYNKTKRFDPIEEFDKRYERGELLAVMTTDTVPRHESFSKEHEWYNEISIAPRIAETIFSLHFNESVARVHLDEL